MVRDELATVLAEEGLAPMPAVNEGFDPSRHEAVLYEDSDRAPEGKVIHIIRQGYTFRGRVLRPAQVAVSRGKGSDGQQNHAGDSTYPIFQREA